MPFFKPSSILTKSYSALVDGDVFEYDDGSGVARCVAVAFDSDGNNARCVVSLSGPKAFALTFKTHDVKSRSLRLGVLSGLSMFLSVNGIPTTRHGIEVQPGVLVASDNGAHVVVSAKGMDEPETFSLLSLSNWAVSQYSIHSSFSNWVGYHSWRLISFDDLGEKFESCFIRPQTAI